MSDESKLYRAAPALYALGIFILFEIAYVRPTWIFQVVAVAALLTIAAVLKICSVPKLRQDNFFKAVIPVALVCAGVGFAYLLESAALRHALALLIALIVALFLRSLPAQAGLPGTAPVSRTEAYGRFENFSGYAITFSIFFSASVLFGLRVLLSLRFWIVGLIFLVVLAILNYTMLWLSQGERPAQTSASRKFQSGRPAPIRSDESQSGRRSVLLFSGVLTIAVFELFLVFAFLPVYFMVSGAALTIFWYTVMLISRAKLLGLLNRRMVYRHITLGAVLLAGLLLTSRWE